MTPTRRPVQRILISLLAAAGLVAGGVLSAAPGGPASPSLSTTYDAQVAQRAEVAARVATAPAPGRARRRRWPTHGRTATGTSTTTRPPRTRSAAAARPRPRRTHDGRPARASRVRVAAQRTQREPRLVGVPLRGNAAGSRRTSMRWPAVATASAGCRSPSRRPASARYLLYGADRTFLAAAGSGAAAWAAAPSPGADWTVRRAGEGRFTFTLADGRALRRTSLGPASPPAPPRPWRCAGRPAAPPSPRWRPTSAAGPSVASTSFQEVRGYVDPHVHGQTHEFLGGRVICSPPFHPYGAAAALVDCPDHQVAGGRGALLEDVLAGNTPGEGHDPVGWPTFSYWPNPHSLTHQQVYYKWLERSWRAGLRSTPACSPRTTSSARSTRSRRTRATTETPCGYRPRTCARCRTTSTRSTAVPAAAGTASSPTRSRPGRSSTGQARGGHGHGDLGAAGVQRPARPAHLHRGADARRARGDEEARRQPDGADQQVRQRVHRRRR